MIIALCHKADIIPHVSYNSDPGALVGGAQDDAIRLATSTAVHNANSP